MPRILSFPKSLFAESPAIPIRTSPSAEEAALNRPRPGPQLVNHAPHPAASPNDGKDFRDSGKTVALLDLELARRSNRSRLRHIFSPSSNPGTWPQSAA